MAIKVLTDSKRNGAVNSHNGQANGHLNGHSQSLSNGNANGHSKRPAASQEPIAICGMAMRLPGGINDADAFWDVLYNGKDMQSPIPSDRYNALAFSDALGKKGAIKAQKGYFLSNDLSCLDASFFSMTKADLEKMDPQQRQILEVTRECLENAGEVGWRGKPIGCYVGMFGEDWQHSMSKENQTSGTFAASGDLMMANRVSYEFDFKGPRCVPKTHRYKVLFAKVITVW
jgi:acyl transferase domain-containing protein